MPLCAPRPFSVHIYCVITEEIKISQPRTFTHPSHVFLFSVTFVSHGGAMRSSMMTERNLTCYERNKRSQRHQGGQGRGCER